MKYNIMRNEQHIHIRLLINLITEPLLQKEKLIGLNVLKLTKCELLPSVKIIKKGSFKGCLNLKEVTILGEDFIIEDEAFSGC